MLGEEWGVLYYNPIEESWTKFLDKRYPIIYREIENLGRQYIDGRLGINTLDELARGIDSLDRL